MISAKPASRPLPVNALPQLSGRPARNIGQRGPLVVIPQNCTGCRTCELACSFAHSLSGSLGHSRIRVYQVGHERHVQVTCLQCVEAACVKVCPSEALIRNKQTGAIGIDENRCIGCGLCATACPFGHMHFNYEIHMPQKCDLCGGQPVCAKFCPHGALEWS